MSGGTSAHYLWTAQEAVAATGGRSDRPWQAGGVSIDSRTVTPGDLFVALQGPNFDGHDFVAKAFAAGAAAVMVARRPDGLAPNLPVLEVADTLAALEALGRHARERSRAKVIAVTGSVGKTGTKEALLKCLAAEGPSYATQGSLNNHWGVPLSLARLPADCRFAVFELGMNHAGEIGPLSRLVRPDVGVITTIEPAHMEFFASLEAIADAKAELFEGVVADGCAVLNRDNGQFGRLLAAARGSGLANVKSFGADPRADARILECSVHATCSVVTVQIAGERLHYCVSLPGRHWVSNSLAVLLAVQAVGADLHGAARVLGQLAPVKGRGTRKRIHLNQGSFTLIDESYNASPAAMAAAFQVLGETDPGAGGRRIAVLGDMRELGARSDAYHAALAEPLTEAGVDLVFCAGEHMAALFQRLPHGARGGWAETSVGLIPMVIEAVRGGDVVLIKGSAGSKMAPLVSALTDLESADERSAVPAAAQCQ